MAVRVDVLVLPRCFQNQAAQLAFAANVPLDLGCVRFVHALDDLEQFRDTLLPRQPARPEYVKLCGVHRERRLGLRGLFRVADGVERVRDLHHRMIRELPLDRRSVAARDRVKPRHPLGQARVQLRGVEQIVQPTVQRARADETMRTVATKHHRRHVAIADARTKQKRLGDLVAAVNQVVLAKRLAQLGERGALHVSRLAKPLLDRPARFAKDRGTVEPPKKIKRVQPPVAEIERLVHRHAIGLHAGKRREMRRSLDAEMLHPTRRLELHSVENRDPH